MFSTLDFLRLLCIPLLRFRSSLFVLEGSVVPSKLMLSRRFCEGSTPATQGLFLSPFFEHCSSPRQALLHSRVSVFKAFRVEAGALPMFCILFSAINVFSFITRIVSNPIAERLGSPGFSIEEDFTIYYSAAQFELPHPSLYARLLSKCLNS